MMVRKTDDALTDEDRAAVEKLKQEAEQTKEDAALNEVSAIESEPNAEDSEARALNDVEAAEAIDDVASEKTSPGSVPYKKKLLFVPWWKRRKIVIPIGIASVLLVLLLALLIPPVRYFALGWVQRSVSISVQDASNRAQLVGAEVTIDGKKYTTDKNGVVAPTLGLGIHTASVSYQNYATKQQTVTIDLFSSSTVRSELTATGRAVTIALTDRVTGSPIIGAEVLVDKKTIAKSDTKGSVRVIVPVDKKELMASVRADKYLEQQVKLTNDTKSVRLVPQDAIFFLSKASGKIDVVKSNLDGSDRKTIVAGTGAEEDRETTLLASRDWKKLMLLAKRDASRPAGLFIIDAASGAMKAVDQGNASVQLIGWSGRSFIYLATTPSNNDGSRAAGTIQLRSYNADNDKVAVLDRNAGETTPTTQQASLWEEIDNAYITDKGIVYSKVWYTRSNIPRAMLDGKQAILAQVQADGSNKKTLAGFNAEATTWIQAKLYEPQGIYFQINSYKDGKSSVAYGEAEDGAYKQIPSGPANFDTAEYPTFLVSPNGQATFWSESRDGKKALFTGDKLGANKQEVAVASEFTPYGWLGDDKVLLQKNNSELYVTTIDQLKKASEPLKISDYHKATTIAGYGYGYGGQ